MHLVHMKDEIELADILEAFVQRFNKDLDQIQDAKLRFARVDAEHKVEGGVVSVDELVVRASDQAEITKKIDYNSRNFLCNKLMFPYLPHLVRSRGKNKKRRNQNTGFNSFHKVNIRVRALRFRSTGRFCKLVSLNMMILLVKVGARSQKRRPHESGGLCQFLSLDFPIFLPSSLQEVAHIVVSFGD